MAEGDSGTGLSNRLCAGYGVGMIGGQIFRDTPALLLLPFMTDALGIGAAIAGMAIFVPKFWVVFADPLAGIFSDRISTRWGRRRPFMFWGGLATVALFILMFHVPAFDTPLARAAYVSAMYTLALTAFAAFSVPYLTMGSEMTPHSRERTRLMSWRVGFMATGLIVSGYAGRVREFGGAGEDGYSFMAFTLGAVCLLTMMTTVLSTGKARFHDRHETTLGLGEQFRLAFRNRPFLNLLGANFLQRLAEGTGYAALVYFMLQVLEQSYALIGTVVLFVAIGGIVAQPFSVWFTARVGKMRAYVAFLLSYCVVFSCWLLPSPEQQWLILSLAFGNGFLNAGFVLLGLSMLTDTVAHDRAMTGLNREGAYSGVWMANEKVAFALGALIVGTLLGWFGYIESTGGMAPVQPDSARTGIILGFVVVPVIIHLSSLLFLRRYELVEQDLPAAARPVAPAAP